ncbi:hypothetical protein EXN66_Car010096 [Channa argus]|uniref:Uncharacterized protein n=1 Tax=Channa argus TaxID=215402 RepID=A0A6G1PVS2_CHAAH|nr:hypothetical protein EXN66_Car010096 [Channa argus]KAK2905606.1 hypothetical protein Q8A73_009549 [Channa argus]
METDTTHTTTESEELIKSLHKEILQLRMELEYERVHAKHREKFFLSKVKLLKRGIEGQAGLAENYKKLYVAAQSGFEGMVRRLRRRLSHGTNGWSPTETSKLSEDRSSDSVYPSDAETESQDNDPELVSLVSEMDNLWVEWQQYENPPEDRTAGQEVTDQSDMSETQGDEEEDSSSSAASRASTPETAPVKPSVEFIKWTSSTAEDRPLLAETENLSEEEEDVPTEPEILTEEPLCLVSANEQVDMWVLCEGTDEPESPAAEPPQLETKRPSRLFSGRVVKGVCVYTAVVIGVGAVAVAVHYFRENMQTPHRTSTEPGTFQL